MSFHQDIVSLTPFVPHDYHDLVARYAFREDALPEAAYTRLVSRYEETHDVRVQRIVYLSNGLNITGLIAEPVGACKGVVVYNRGGSGNFGMLTVHAVVRQIIPLARAGYLVVASNYRGNDGGDGQDEFGGRDVDDSIALHRIAMAHPAADDVPTFIIGHSRGCMMTYLMLKQGFRAKAAACIAGVAELRDWNVFRSEMRERVYKRYIPDFEAYEEESLEARSAICWPEKISAPLLLLHGTGDDRVQHSQSEGLAAALEQHGNPHELMLYEGGNHALTRHWDDVMKRTLDWFSSHA